MPHSDPVTRKKNLFSNSVYSTKHKTRKDIGLGTPLWEDHKSMSTQTNFNSSTTVNLNQPPKKVQVYRETQTQTSRTVISLDRPRSSRGDYSPDSLSPRFDNYRETLSPRSTCENCSFPLHGFSSPRRKTGDLNQQLHRNNQESSTELDKSNAQSRDFSHPVAEKVQNVTSPRQSLPCQMVSVGDTGGTIICCGDVFKPKLNRSDLVNVSSHKRNQVINYLDQCETCHQCEMCEKKQKELLAGNMLMKTFLEKNRGKMRVSSYSDGNYHADKLRSRSYVEELQLSPASPQLRGKTKIPVARSTMRTAEEKFTELNRPLHHQCHSSFLSNLDEMAGMEMKAKSHSFMSPTISSERKDKSIEIKCLGKLISPTRRGRSTSPDQDSKVVVIGKVPYIDKSDITFDKTTGSRKDSKHSVKSSCNETASNTSTGSTENALFQAIGKLRDENWNTALRGLAEVVEICRVADSELIFPHMTVINQRLLELIKSPRSHVCRTSCQAVGHLFEFIKDTRRPEFDELVDTLLCKCADANKFIRHDANLALDCMVTHMPTFHAVRSVCSKAPAHKNPLVRTAAARLVVCAVVMAGTQSLLHPQSNEHTRRRVVLNMVKFMEDRYGDVRKYGERIYKTLNKDRTFELYLNRYLERDVVNKLRQTFRT